MVKFCVTQFIKSTPYPNAAQWSAEPYTKEWRQFSVNYPFSEPVHFFEYLDQFNIPYCFVDIEEADRATLYPISISYFDFSVNWFRLLPNDVLNKLKNKSLTLWFFYSEGDNPYRIQKHLYSQAKEVGVDPSLVQFTSANTVADNIPGFHYFADDECLYQLRNTDLPVEFHNRVRNKKFTALVRTHKWWRATTMARIWRDNYHTQGYFSYNTALPLNDNPDDNPISIDQFYQLRKSVGEFIKAGPYIADNQSEADHNDYSNTVVDHFSDSYLNVILETHLNVDETDGTFITEKTFKPIKHSQPFIMFGPFGTIKHLKSMGYRTFDHVIDHSYDSISDNTARWNTVYQEFQRLMHCDLHKIYQQCQDDLLWNQSLFLSDKKERLNSLLTRIVNYATNCK